MSLFFTPIDYGSTAKTCSEFLLENVDSYFHINGKKAYVIGKTKAGNQKVVIDEAPAQIASISSSLIRIAKRVSYLTLVMPAIMLTAKACLRWYHTFKVVDVQKKLEKGLGDIPEETLLKVKNFLQKIDTLDPKNSDEIDCLSYGNNFVFKLKDDPRFVFKTSSPRYESGKIIDDRFNNMLAAKRVCLINQLGLLVIPSAKKIRIGKTDFIVERVLDIDIGESFQEHLYKIHSKNLDKTFRQLAIFIAKTGFNDVAFRNIPLLNEEVLRRVCLIDLEHMESASIGLKGSSFNGSRGLVRCASSKEQIDSIIQEAGIQGVKLSDNLVKELREERLKEIEENDKLYARYADKGITGKEPIEVDINSLGLDLSQVHTSSFITGKKMENGEWEVQQFTFTLEEVAKAVIDEINRKLQEEAPHQTSVKGKRHIFLNTGDSNLTIYASAGSRGIIQDEDDAKEVWIRKIIDALVDNGHLFKLDKNQPWGYAVQA